MVQEKNYLAELKTRQVGPKKWVVSIPIVLSDRCIPRGYDSDRADDEVYRVKESALKYVASERIKTLARPKDRLVNNISASPSTVKTSALSYVPSNRIIQLARPKDQPPFV